VVGVVVVWAAAVFAGLPAWMPWSALGSVPAWFPWPAFRSGLRGLTGDAAAAAQWLMRGTSTGPVPAGPATFIW